MKTVRIITLMAIFISLVSVTTSSAQSNDNALIGRARAELAQCVAEAHASGFDVSAGVQVTGTCPDGSEQKEVVFIGTFRCAPFEPCPRIALFIGSVQFDCDGNVISSQCGAPQQ